MLGYDVLVIGGGAAGSATAWQLARRGQRVCLLEQHEPGHARGSSHGSSRIVRLTYPEAMYVALAQEALGLWRDLEAETGTSLLCAVGGMDAGDPVRLARTAQAMDQVGVAHAVVDERDAQRRWPHLRLPGPVLVQQDAARADADATLRVLQGRAQALGAEVLHRMPVRSLSVRSDGVVAHTAAGDRSAPVAVVSVGAWTSELLGGLVDLPPLQVTQEQVLHLRPRDPAAVWPAFVVDDAAADGKATEGAYGKVLYGLPTAAEGVKVAEHLTGAVVSADGRDGEVDPAGRERVLDFARRCLPGLVQEPQGEATCLYTTTVTEDFVIDRVGPLVVGTACSGHGFKFTPLVGRMLADLALGVGEPVDRFRLPTAARR